jgi:predicted TIM-barrel enzyme
VRAAAPDTPILVGSGVDAQSVAALLSVADGVIVGTWLKRDGRVENPVDPARVRQLVAAARR